MIVMSIVPTTKTLSRILWGRGLTSTPLLPMMTTLKCSRVLQNSFGRLKVHHRALPLSTRAMKDHSNKSDGDILVNSKTLLREHKKKQEARHSEMLLQDIKQEFKETVTAKKKRSEQQIPAVETIIAADAALQSPDYFQVHNLFTVRDLFAARVHLGHKVGSLDARMKDFIFGSRFDATIFDLDKTAFHLRQALNFTAHIAYRSGIILFLTRSPQSMHLVEKTAIECGEYVHCREWNTHVLTNAEDKFGGITRLPDLMIFLNTLDTVMTPHGAVFDANKMLIPTIGIVDSNCNPNLITFPVPGNDDTLSAIEFYCKVFKEAIMRGKQKRRNVEKKIRDAVSKAEMDTVSVAGSK